MATIKKVFQPIMSLLTANPTATVAEILDEVTALASAKVASGIAQFHANEAGEVLVAHCAYFQRFFIVAEMPFGAKASSKSGLNTYSKEGMANFNAQQAAFKKASGELVDRVISGDLAPEDLGDVKAELEAARTAKKDTKVRSFETLEDAIAAL